MESKSSETAWVWTDEKHLHFLKTMEASFVRTMLRHRHRHRHRHHRHQPLRLDRYLPDTSESTLDSKPNKHALRESMGRNKSRSRRTKRRSSKNQLQDYFSSSLLEQAVSELENGRESGASVVGGDDKESRSED